MLQNRLYHVNDNTDYDALDIDNQGAFSSSLNTINTANNYSYDEIGQLKKDTQEEIQEIIWRVDGKVKEIKRPLLSTKKNLKFDYACTERNAVKSK